MSGFYSYEEGPMASTSVHPHRELVQSLDALAARRRNSRNRLIAEACERLIRQDAGEWPEGFFTNADSMSWIGPGCRGRNSGGCWRRQQSLSQSAAASPSIATHMSGAKSVPTHVT